MALLWPDALGICGVDEAGRGPLAGPVVAAAVILNPKVTIEGLNDSKKLSARRRASLAEQIREQAISFCVAEASVDEIDTLNILKATMLAMERAVSGLNAKVLKVLVDGNKSPHLPYPVHPIVGGDGLHAAIAAASIMAKTTRDALMLKLHEAYPVYGFDRHMGYPTALHLEALANHGVSPVHRRSYAPVALLLQS